MARTFREVGVNNLSEWLPGVAAMANVHPLIVHFPIALLSTFVVVEAGAWLLGRETWRIAASALLYLGTLGAAGAVTAGWLAAQTVPHGEAVHDILERHEHLGFTVLTLALLLSVWRLWRGKRFGRFERGCHFLLALLMTGIMTVGVDLGGLMVYGHGVGVRGIDTETESHDHAAPDAVEEDDVPGARY
jgi:uncharacterized membrane protein